MFQTGFNRLLALFTPSPRRTIERAALDALDVSPTDVALVIGTDNGHLIAELSRRITTGFVAGIDATKANVRRSSRRNRVALREGRIELLQADAATIPYPDGMFDLVYALDPESADEMPDGMFTEITRVLRPGGRLLLREPANSSIRSRLDEAGRHIVGDRESATLAGRARIQVTTVPGAGKD